MAAGHLSVRREGGYAMNERDEKIIRAVVEKARRVCPGSLALVGVYGSARTGDTHARSDLDLLILINDDNGWRLATGFILDDVQIGYDIYCTSWQMLEDDAACPHAHLGKLMDSEIVYLADQSAQSRLEKLRERAAALLRSDERFRRADDITDRLCRAYAEAMSAASLGKARAFAAYAVSLSLDAVMLKNGRYFRRGVKRTFEELDGLPLPQRYVETIGAIVRARDMAGLAAALTALVRAMLAYTRREGEKQPSTPDALRGTYEEMFSNWRSKMPEAAARGDAFSSFMNMASLQAMLDDIAGETDIPAFDVMASYDPDDLAGNARAFDDALSAYRREYDKLGMTPRRYRDVDEFVKDYLG